MSVNRSIPALYQGVSQQPPAMRAPEQCERMENAYPSVAEGVNKRPPTQHIAKLTSSTPVNAKVHQYNRGNGEQYVVGIWQDGTVQVWDRNTGVGKAVNIDGSANTAYITTANPIDNLGMLTVADTTFIWNRNVKVATKASTLSAPIPTLYVFLKQALPDVAYTIALGTFGTVAVQHTGGAANTIQIAQDLKAAIDALVGAPFTVVQTNNLLSIQRTDHSDFSFDVYDQAGGSLIIGFKNRVERYADLPRVGVEGAVVEVRGQGDSGGKSSFWVKYQKGTGKEMGWWEETVAPIPGEPTDLDPATMPQQLVRQADGTFKLLGITWAPRLVGSTSNHSAPVPSFVGQSIACVFFYRNRLGVLSEENIGMSRANDLFNYWPKSASTVNDDDPIDVTANTAKVAMLRHAVPFQRQLMLFSDNTQFPLTGGEVLSPKNVRVDSATEFDCSALVSPVSSGQDLFFVFERASSTGITRHSGVREYFVNQSAVTNDATDVTGHVPQYIPGNVHHASVSSTEDILLLLSKDEWNRVYFYKYLWDGDKRIQSAWGRWTLRPNDKILSAEVDRTTVHLVIQRESGVFLERMELQTTATTGFLSFQIRLDSLVQVDPGFISYDSLLGRTTVTIPYTPTSDVPSTPTFVSDAAPNSSGSIIPVIGLGGTNIFHLKGDWTDRAIYCGFPYEHHHTFSQQYMRDREGTPITQGRLQLKYFTINFRDGVTFRVDVETLGRDTSTYRYSSFRLGFSDSILGQPTVHDSSFGFRTAAWTFPLASKSTNCQWTLINDSPYPCAFYSGEWEGEFNTRSQRA